MFTSFDENVFRQAIKEKDYLCLKVNTISTILDDPTFERGETMKVLKILEEQVPEIFEEYMELDYEERLEHDKWDKRYFTKLTYWFQENFAKERIAYIKEVGNVVHKDTAKKYAESNAMSSEKRTKLVPSSDMLKTGVERKQPVKNISEREKHKQLDSKAQEKLSDKKDGNFSIAGASFAVVALVVVGILLFKVLVK